MAGQQPGPKCLCESIFDPLNTYPYGWYCIENVIDGGCFAVDGGSTPYQYLTNPAYAVRGYFQPSTKPKPPDTVPPPDGGPDTPPDGGPTGDSLCHNAKVYTGGTQLQGVDRVPAGYTSGPSGWTADDRSSGIIAVNSVDLASPYGRAWAYVKDNGNAGHPGMYGIIDGIAANANSEPAIVWGDGCTTPFYKADSTTTTPPDEKCCPPDTSPALLAIKEAIDNLTSQVAKEAFDCNNIAEDCLGKITDQVIARLKKSTKTCSQCCHDISAGISHTTAEALICAACECEDCHRQCSLGDPDNEGKCCDTCGQAKCICHGEECIPVEEPEPPKKKFYAYCQIATGQKMIVEELQTEIADGWEFLGYASSPDEAALLLQGCGIPTGRPPIIPPEPVAPSGGNTPWQCNLAWWGSGQAPQALASWGQDAVAWTYLADVGVRIAERLGESVGQIPVVGPAVLTAVAPLQSSIAITTALAPIVAKLAGCDGGSVEEGLKQLAMFGTMSKYAGVDFSEFAMPIVYAINSECRLKVLNPDKAIATWLANSTDDKDLDTVWAMHGICQESLDRYKVAVKSKITPDHLAILRRRETITQSDYDRRMRQLGYINQEWVDQEFSLSEERPAPSDIVRMMVRDADDLGLVNKFGMDDKFTDKYQAQLKKWAKDQGIPDEIMKYLWRAHWSIPSPGQLYEMYHRLRYKPEYGGPDKFLGDIKDALIQQDILPYWIDKFLAVSFRPIGRVDVRRAYNIGAIDDARVTQAYQELGYNDADAQTMLIFSRKLRDQAAIGNRAIKLWVKWALSGQECRDRMLADGIPESTVTHAMTDASVGFDTSWPVKAFKSGELPAQNAKEELFAWGVESTTIDRIIKKSAGSVTYHPSAAMFAAGTMSYQQALNDMTGYGISAGRIAKILQKPVLAMTVKSTAECVDAIRSRYIFGELDGQAATGELKGRGLTDERSSLLMQQWNCESSAISKQVTASQLCSWLGQGVITPLQFIERLDRMGYRQEDAVQMLVDCQGTINQKQVKEAIASAKATAAAIAKQQAQQRRQQSQLNKQQAQLTRARNLAKEAKQRRSKQSSSAAEKLYKASGYPLSDVTAAVQEAYDRLNGTMALTPDEALQAILLASESYASDNLADYQDLTNTYAQMIIDRALQPDEIPPG